VAVAGVLTGAVRTVTVTTALPSAVYLSTLDPDTPAICLAAADAVRVPCAVVLPPGVPVPRPPVGTAAWIGDGRITFGGCRGGAVVTRWWRPARPNLGTTPTGTLAERLDAALPGTTWTDPDLPWAGADRLAATLARAAQPESHPEVAGLTAAVARLLGGGPGLTPVGDDVLAGALVTLSAAGRAGRTPGSALARSVRSALRTPAGGRPAESGRTTHVSAALLAHAVRGECIPQLAALLEALDAGQPDAAVRALLAVGHSSGTGLLLGIRTALTVLLAGTPPVPLTTARTTR
jgi:hypothetical protein